MNCRICGHQNHKTIFTKNPYRIYQCINCGFGWLHPLPSDLKSLYQDDYHDYLSSSDFQADAQKKFSFVKSYLSKQDSILDYGCGQGHFLAQAQEEGYKVLGLDVSVSAAKTARKKFKITVKTKVAKNTFPKNSFNAITCFDVIEHIPNFFKLLSWFKFWLKPGGYIFLTTPNLDVWDAKIMGLHWYGFTRIPQHVNYFNYRSLKSILEQSEFSLQVMTTWGFVRSLGYLCRQYAFTRWLEPVFIKLKLDQTKIYLPMTDMIAVAKKD